MSKASLRSTRRNVRWREAGMVRVQTWLKPEDAAALDRLQKREGLATRTEAVAAAIRIADTA